MERIAVVIAAAAAAALVAWITAFAHGSEAVGVAGSAAKLAQPPVATGDWFQDSTLRIAVFSVLAAAVTMTSAWIMCGPKRRKLTPRVPRDVRFVSPRTRVLFIALPGATAADEYSALQELPPSVHESFSFCFKRVVSAVQLAQVLIFAEHFDVLHLSGLGLSFDSGGTLDVDTLGRQLKTKPCKLVIFNACGTVQSLQRFVVHGGAVAVGTTAGIDNDRAIEFSVMLYSRLASKDSTTGVYCSFAAAMQASCVSLDASSLASYLDANPEVPLLDRKAPFLQHVPRPLVANPDKVALYFAILSHARTPRRFCSFTYVGKDTLRASQAWGVQYDLSELWGAGALASDFAPLLAIPSYRRPLIITGVTEQRQATYYVNVIRAVTGEILGPGLFAVADGDVYFHGADLDSFDADMARILAPLAFFVLPFKTTLNFSSIEPPRVICVLLITTLRPGRDSWRMHLEQLFVVPVISDVVPRPW